MTIGQKPRGGFVRPYRTSLLIRDIIFSHGTSHLQRISTELRQRISAIPRTKGRPRHLPGREAIRVYIYLAFRLGLIRYTGVEDTAHRKSAGGLIPAPDLARVRFLELVPGTENHPSWGDLWKSYNLAAATGFPNQPTLPRLALQAISPPPEIEAPKPPRAHRGRKAPPAKPAVPKRKAVEKPVVKPKISPRQAAAIHVPAELRRIRREITDKIIPLVDALPGTLAALDLELAKIRQSLRPLEDMLTPGEKVNVVAAIDASRDEVDVIRGLVRSNKSFEEHQEIVLEQLAKVVGE